MSSPSFENIDQWFFEFVEGNLSPAQQNQLMEFISQHPELMEELKTWQQANYQAPTQPEFNSAILLKRSSFYTHPAFVAASSVIVVFIAIWAYLQYTPEALYSESKIDTNIITTGEKESRIFFAESSFDTENSNNETTVSLTSSYKSTENNLIATNNTEQESKSYLNKKEVIAIENFYETNTNELIAEGIIENVHHYRFPNKTDELDIVIASIERDYSHQVVTDIVAEKTEVDILEEIEITEGKSVSSSSNKSNFARSIQSTMRKIQRMIDQPTALRNTQEPYYHAPMMIGFKANSSMVGGAFGNRLIATSRWQWAAKDNSQLMNTVSWDGYVYGIRGGFGISLNYNTLNKGDINNYFAQFSYSPKLSINKNISLEPSISFKMGAVALNQSTPLIGNSIEMNRYNAIPLFEGEESSTGGKLWYRDVGLGLMLNTKQFYIGFNADNLGRHNNNFYSSDIHKKYRENIHYTAVAGTEYQSFTKDVRFNFYGLFQNYGSLNELWIGSNFRYKWMQVGAGVSTRADFGASAGIEFNQIGVHYNIDYTKSKLMDKKFLSHQLTMKILLKPSKYATKYIHR